MWTELAFSVGQQRVTLSIELLKPVERDAVALSLAWLAVESASRDEAVNVTVWKTLLEDVLGPHIAFTVDHGEPDALGSVWWRETFERATFAFIRANELEGLIRRSLSSVQAIAAHPGALSQ